MQIDVVLCDHGQVSGDKLFVAGGGIDRMYVADQGAPYVVNFGVAGTVTVTPEEASTDHVLSLRLDTPDGEPAALTGVADGALVAGELGLNRSQVAIEESQVVAFAFNFQGVPLAAPGAYVMRFWLDGTEVRRLTFAAEVVGR